MSKNFSKKNYAEKIEFPYVYRMIHTIYGKTKPYRYAEECDLIYRAAIGMTAKEYRIAHGIQRGDNIRKYLTSEQVELIDLIALNDVGLLLSCPHYIQRKIYLEWVKFKRQEERNEEE